MGFRLSASSKYGDAADFLLSCDAIHRNIYHKMVRLYMGEFHNVKCHYFYYSGKCVPGAVATR
jgi:hypothetical protein